MSRRDSKALSETEKPSASEQISGDELGEEVPLAITEYHDERSVEKLPYQTTHDNQKLSRQDVNGILDKVWTTKYCLYRIGMNR